MRKPLLWFVLAFVFLVPGGFFLSHGRDSLRLYHHGVDHMVPEAKARIAATLHEIEASTTSERVAMYTTFLEQDEQSYRAVLDGNDELKSTARTRLLGGGALALLGIAFAVVGLTRLRRGRVVRPNHLRASDLPANVGGDASASHRADPGVA